MARKIDDSKPLSKADRQWLKDWGREAEIARIDAMHGTNSDDADAEPAADTTRLDLVAVLTKYGIDPGDDPVAAVDSLLADAEAEDDDDSGEPQDGYDDMNVEALKDELEKRDLPKSGNKDDLIARLREDDAQ